MERPLHLLGLSARTPDALLDLVRRYALHLRNQPALTLADIAFTAHTGRARFEHRLAIRARTTEDLRRQLEAIHPLDQLDGACLAGRAPASRAKVRFLFPAVGQELAFARELALTQPTFHRALEECRQAVNPSRPGQPLESLPDAWAFAVQYALARLWHSWGVEPDLMLGEGVGELVAVCLAGGWPLAEILPVVATRGPEQRPQQLAALTVRPLKGELVCSRTGRIRAVSDVLGPDFWQPSATESVPMSQAVQALRGQGAAMCLSFGTSPPWCPEELSVLTASGWDGLLQALGRAWLAGVEIDWRGYDRDYRRTRDELPTYPFQRQRFWLGDGSIAPGTNGSTGQHPLLGQRLRSAQSIVKFACPMGTQGLLGEHHLLGTAIVSATTYLELVLAAARQAFHTDEWTFLDAGFLRPLHIPENGRRLVHVVLSPTSKDVPARFQVLSLALGESDTWVEHVRGRLRPATPEDWPERSAKPADRLQPSRGTHSTRRCNNWAWPSDRVFTGSKTRTSARVAPGRACDRRCRMTDSGSTCFTRDFSMPACSPSP